MISLQVRMTGLLDLKQHLRSVRRLTRAHTRQRLHMWGRKIRDDVKKSRPFKHESGELKKSLWTKQNNQRGKITQQIGWGVPHGEVLEFGPRREKMWAITPRGFRSDISYGRSGGGVALRFLRFEYKGKICYARNVIHVWDNSQLRPHIEPALKRNVRTFLIDMASIPRRVIEGELR